MFDVPVVLIAFNRPDLTKLTLDRIREVQPKELFLLVDGPRPGRPDDTERCAEVRSVLADIDWPVEVHRRYSDQNLGCDSNIELGLDAVFEQVDRAILLEDDCLPDPTFFGYCAELLARHEDDPDVWQVSGNTLFLTPGRFGQESYVFTAFGSVWGWATWRRAWQAHRELFPRGRGGGAARIPAAARDEIRSARALATPPMRRYFVDVATSTRPGEFGWDSYWWLSMVRSGGLAATPSRNLVENHGFRDDATNTGTSRPDLPAEAMPFPLVHPREVATDPAVERELERMLVRATGRLARTVRRFVPAGRMRRVLRVVGDAVSFGAGKLRARR